MTILKSLLAITLICLTQYSFADDSDKNSEKAADTHKNATEKMHQGKGQYQCKHHAGKSGQKHGMHQGKMHGKHMGMMTHMMEKLNLSPDQKQKMQALMKDKKNTMKPIRRELRQITQTFRKLDTMSPNYKAQVFSLADAKAKRVHRMMIEKGEMRMKVESLLNPEQLKKHKQMRKQRRKAWSSGMGMKHKMQGMKKGE